jgi:gamma-glutamylcyclotransferase (GGCT)/AIG2-like uncharacterized protein YtfP
MRYRVFVYGTLRRGESNHAVIARARFLGTARTRPEWRRVSIGPYPALAPGGDVIEGELYEVDAALLAALDRVEDVPRLYRRVTLTLEDGTHAEAYVQPG